ncbi:MAG: hypothetical protein WKF56_03315 [Candidatus Limnocylindrales bacterium]
MPSKLPAPVAGTAEQADPKVSPVAALPEGAADIDSSALAEGDADIDAISDGSALAAAEAAVLGAADPAALDGARVAPPVLQAVKIIPATARPERVRLNLRTCISLWFSCSSSVAREPCLRRLKRPGA